jgi:hypothetical protein
MEDFGTSHDASPDNQTSLDAIETTLYPPTDKEIGYVNAAFLFLFMIIGIPWNGLVIAMILKKKIYSRPSGMLMLNLTVANLLLCIVHMPLPVVGGIGNYSLEEFKNFHGACQAAAILFILLLLVVLHTVALMSVDRAIYLKKPLTYDHIVTPWRTLTAIITVWVICLAISLPPLFGFGKAGYTNTFTCILHSQPFDNIGHYFILVTAFGSTGFVAQMIGCGCIIYITRKHLLKRLHRVNGSSQRSEGQRSEGQRSEGQRSEGQRSEGQRSDDQKLEIMDGKNSAVSKYKQDQLQMVKVFGGIFTASSLTAVPAISLGVAILFSAYTNWFATAAYLSVLSKSVVHPIVESYMTYETRETISEIFSDCRKKKCCCVQRTVEEQ